jgi:hypothetical protein
MVQKLRDSACSPTDIMQISGQTGSQLMLGFPNCEDINLSNLQTQTCSFIVSQTAINPSCHPDSLKTRCKTKAFSFRLTHSW